MAVFPRSTTGLWLCVILAFVYPTGAAANPEVRYVTDKLRLSVYPKSNGEGERLGVLSSGTRVTVLKKNGAYARIRTRDGLEGWVKAAYLQKEPTAALRLARLEQENQSLRDELERLRAKSSAPPEQVPDNQAPGGPDPRIAVLEEELQSLRTVHEALLEEYESLRRSQAAPATAPDPESPSLQAPRRADLWAQLRGPAWLGGALALVAGLLLGLVAGRRSAEARLRRRLYGFRLE